MPGTQRAAFSNNHRKTSKDLSQSASQTAAASVLLHSEKLKSLYAAMLKCRMLEEKLVARSRRMKKPPAGSAIGNEALLVGATFDLLPGDSLTPSQYESIAAVVQDAPLANAFAGSANESHVAPAGCVELGIAAGMALAFKSHQQPHIALCLADRRMLLDRMWKDAVAFAGERKLPVVYVVQTRSSAKELRHTRLRSNVPAITVDGGDVVAVYRVMQEARRRARQGYGPTLIEGRLQKTDPLRFMEDYLRTRGLWSNAWRAKLEADFRAKLSQASRGKKKRT